MCSFASEVVIQRQPPVRTVRLPIEGSRWLTATEAAEYLQVKTRTLLQWANAGKVKGYPLSGTRRHVWRFLREDLDAMLTGPSVALRTKGAL
jgi:excisionase family DNA binding protein